MAGQFRKNITNAFFSKTSNAKEGFYAPTGAVVKGGIGVAASGRYYYRVFTTNDMFNVINGSVIADIFAIGGGGGGGIGSNKTNGIGGNASFYEFGGGGGGAGGITVLSGQTLPTGNYTVTIGSGGAGAAVGANIPVNGSVGNNTLFGTLVTATGGAYGGGTVGGNGPTGGGAASGTGGAGITYSGGGSTGSYGGGGGGQGQSGVTATTSGESGGSGTNSYSSWLTIISGMMPAAWVTATSGTYIGGGGGGGGSDTSGKISSNAAGGVGGIGGGGKGTNGANLGSVGNATANTGGGGGGGIGDNPLGAGGTNGGTGGSGLVIVRYWNPVATTKSSSAIAVFLNTITKNRGKFIRATISAGILTKKNVKKIARVYTIDTIKSAKLVFKTLKTTFSAAPKVTKSVAKTVKTLYINSVKSIKAVYKKPRLIVVIIPYFSKKVSKSVSAVSIKTFNFTSGKVLSKVAKNIVVSAQKLTRQVKRNRKAIVVQPVQATVTRNISSRRKSSVTVSYSIASTRKRTAIRRAIATVSAIGKNIATRPFYIFTREQANAQYTLASVSETVTSNVDLVGEFTNANDVVPNDYAEPDNPTGEDVVPT